MNSTNSPVSLGRYSTDGHTLFVERTTQGHLPLKAYMGRIAFDSRAALGAYEPSESIAVNVPGGGPSRSRLVVTQEGSASYIMKELFVQGLDGGMWYVRVAALRHVFDAQIADALLSSFAIDVPKGANSVR